MVTAQLLIVFIVLDHQDLVELDQDLYGLGPD